MTSPKLCTKCKCACFANAWLSADTRPERSPFPQRFWTTTNTPKSRAMIRINNHRVGSHKRTGTTDREQSTVQTDRQTAQTDTESSSGVQQFRLHRPCPTGLKSRSILCHCFWRGPVDRLRESGSSVGTDRKRAQVCTAGNVHKFRSSTTDRQQTTGQAHNELQVGDEIRVG